MKSFARGYSPHAHLLTQGVLAAGVLALAALIVFGWLCTIQITADSEDILRTLSEAVLSNVDLFHSAIMEGATLFQNAQQNMRMSETMDRVLTARGIGERARGCSM